METTTERDDLRYTKVPLTNGSGVMPALGFGTLIPDLIDTKNATRLALDTDQDALGHFFGHDPTTVADALSAINLMVKELASRRGGAITIDVDSMATTSDYTGLNI